MFGDRIEHLCEGGLVDAHRLPFRLVATQHLVGVVAQAMGQSFQLLAGQRVAEIAPFDDIDAARFEQIQGFT